MGFGLGFGFRLEMGFGSGLGLVVRVRVRLRLRLRLRVRRSTLAISSAALPSFCARVRLASESFVDSKSSVSALMRSASAWGVWVLGQLGVGQ